MQISETVKRFITDKVTEIYKTKFEAATKKKVDEIITTLELNGGNMETLTQLLHDAAMSL